eukprot:Gb_17725 [translate_table: standard]
MRIQAPSFRCPQFENKVDSSTFARHNFKKKNTLPLPPSLCHLLY